LLKWNCFSFHSTDVRSNLQLHVLTKGSTPNLPFLSGFRDPHLTQCVSGPHKCTRQMESKCAEPFKHVHKRARQTNKNRNQSSAILPKKCFIHISLTSQCSLSKIHTWHYNKMDIIRQDLQRWTLLGPTVYHRKFCQIPRTSLQNSAAYRGKIIQIRSSPWPSICK